MRGRVIIDFKSVLCPMIFYLQNGYQAVLNPIKDYGNALQYRLS